MINLWCSDFGYRIENDEDYATRLYDVDDFEGNALALYHLRWIAFSDAMEDLTTRWIEDGEKPEIMIHSDGKIIEELRGDIETDEFYATASLKFFQFYDSINFSRIDYRKCSRETIRKKLDG